MSVPALPSPTGRSLLRRLLADASGTTAVEFALVGGALVMTIVFVMMLGILLYMNQALDFATSKAARQIMTGYVQKNGTSQSDFRTQLLCPYLPAVMICSDVIVNAQTLTEAAQPGGYYGLVNSTQTGMIIPSLSNSGAQFNVGIQASYVYLQVIYPITFLPKFMSRILANGSTYNGSPAYLAVSTAAFRNEQY